MKRIFILFLFFSFLLTIVYAEELKKEDLLNNIPKDYNKLLEAYTKVVDLAFTYKKLYEEAEASNKRLMDELEKMNERLKLIEESLERMNKTVDVLQSVILKLLGENKISIMGLYNFKDSSLSVGASYRF